MHSGRRRRGILAKLSSAGRAPLACTSGYGYRRIAPDFIRENEFELTTLDDLLRRSDFVSLNCDLNPTSFHLMNDALCRSCGDRYSDQYARGPWWMSRHNFGLQTSRIAGAALDVYEVEPLPPDSPLLQMDMSLAPHNANSAGGLGAGAPQHGAQLLIGLGFTPPIILIRCVLSLLFLDEDKYRWIKKSKTVLITGAAGGIGRATVIISQ